MNRHATDETGAVAVIVALFFASIALILAAIVLDLGGLWSSQRALVTDTDAGSLAGAVELAEDWMENGGECGNRSDARDEAERVLLLNNPENRDISTDADCEEPATAADFSGWVQITAQQPSPGFVSGRDDLSAGGTTTAEFVLGVSDFEEGLAICAELFQGTEVLNPKFVLLNDNLAIPYTKATQTYEGQGETACGIKDQWETSGSPANSTKGGWGWLAGDCSAGLTEPTWCNVDTGTSDLKQTFEPVVGQEIRFPIFDAWDELSGTNANLRIVGHMTATLESTCELKGGGNDPKEPQDCNISSNLSDKFSGQQEFIIVSGAIPFFYNQPDSRMFDEATYSICDVDGDRRFCRATD